jgi:MFS transporter, putative metabolite:H+ symporter
VEPTASSLGARLERLPLSAWHWRMLGVLGLAWAFDGLDSLIIGSIAAALGKAWQLPPSAIGILIGANFAGSVVGALLASMGDRFGRKAIFNWSLLWFSLMSLASAFAWSTQSLIVLRFLTGFGLGAELPIIAAYLGELVPAAARGRTQGLLNSFWPLGTLAAALIAVLVIPGSDMGWRYAFAIGSLPALMVAFTRRGLPESPRWLALNGRAREAEAIVGGIERAVESATGRPLPPPSAHPPVERRVAVGEGLFGRGVAKRTIMLWGLQFFAYTGAAGLLGWMPSLFASAGFSLARSFLYVLIMQVAYVPNQVLGAWLMDRIGRRVVLVGNGLLAAVAGVIYGLLLINHAGTAAILVMGIAVSFFVSAVIGAIQVYGPEQYATAVRATGYGTSRVFGFLGATMGPVLIGFVMPSFGVFGAFCVIAGSFVLASAFVLVLGTETRGLALGGVGALPAPGGADD